MATTENELTDTDKIKFTNCENVFFWNLIEHGNPLLNKIHAGLTSDDADMQAFAKAALDDIDAIVDKFLEESSNEAQQTQLRQQVENYNSILENSVILEKNRQKLVENYKVIEEADPDAKKIASTENELPLISQDEALTSFFEESTNSSDEPVQKDSNFNALKDLYNKALNEEKDENLNIRLAAKNTLYNIENNLIPFYQASLAEQGESDTFDNNSQIFKTTIQAHSEILDASKKNLRRQS